MTNLEIYKRLAVLDAEFKEIYDPATTFGNIQLIKLMPLITELRQTLEETDECRTCSGEGMIAHECNCDKCDYEGEDCDDCEDGRIVKVIEM